jgi:3-oxoacyl-[acyl-carrier-protein] synthase II
MKRVVVTGYGAFTPIGKTAEETWQNAKAGVSGISGTPERVFEATGVRYCGRIKDYKIEDYFERKEARIYDPSAQFAIIAAREACEMANIATIEDRFRVGCNVTSGIGGIQSIEEGVDTRDAKGYKRISPLFIPKVIVNLVAGNVAIDQDAKGICNTLVTACASSTDAIGHAYAYIQSGLVDCMITGGTEASISPMAMAGFNNMKALSNPEDVNKACIPFDKDRSGFVMGEGSCVMILEDYDKAVARGAQIYGEIVGYGASCDASHITAPDVNGVANIYALEMALKCQDIAKEDIKLINAHGTSTPLNDKGEASMIRRSFGEDLAKKVHVTSTKSMTGHLLGGTGALEAYITLRSLNEGVITPTINTTNIDPDCEGLNIALELTEDDTMVYGLSTSLGFGGHNSVIVVKKGE